MIKKTRTLTATTLTVKSQDEAEGVDGLDLSTPGFTLTLNSSDAGRKIEISANDGVEYFVPIQYDAQSATMIMVSGLSSITHVKFTGAINDTVNFVSK